MAEESRNVKNRPDFSPLGRIKALTSVALTTSTGTPIAGSGFDLGACFSNFSFCAVPSGSTKVSIRLQGSLVSSTGPWENISAASTWTSTNAGKVRKSTNTVPVQFVRINIVGWTTSASVDTVSGYIGIGKS